MRDYWIDCITGKQIEMLPEIKKFLIYLNKWNFYLRIQEDRLEIEENQSCFKNILQDDYGIKWLENYNIDEECLVPVDIFYLPYCTHYYNKEHMLHYVIVKKIQDQNVRIFDDNPLFGDWFPYDNIKKANEKTVDLVKQKLPIISYDKTSINSLTIYSEILLFFSKIENISPEISVFLQNMFSIEDLDLRSRLTSDFSMISKKYYAVACAMSHIAEHIKIKDITNHINEYIDYLQKWEIIFSLNTKWSLLKREKDIKKIEVLLLDLMPLDFWVNKFIDRFKEILKNHVEKVCV